MPRAGITAYDLLFSCPGDVIDVIDIIEDCVDNFNRFLGMANNSQIVLRHWSKDSYPQSGDKPQELLNKQFVRNCDAAIAIFWTRFGTPTDKYGSGTEEEIEEMLTSGKQVFMYFMDKPLAPSEVDQEQYDKVKNFKQKYSERGIYAVVKNNEELRKEFTNHLTRHFLPIMMGNTGNVSDKKGPILSVNSIDGTDKCKIKNYKISNSQFNLNLVSEIKQKINDISEIKLPNRVMIDEDIQSDSTQIPGLPNIGETIRKLTQISPTIPLVDADINIQIKEEIIHFCSDFGITINDEFWYVGNLKRKAMVYNMLGYHENPLSGTDDEISKYNLIKNAYSQILDYRQYQEFFKSIECLKFIMCIIENKGDTYDEDIDIKIFAPKGCKLGKNRLPIPDIGIIDKVNSMKFIEKMFTGEDDANIDKYHDYPVNTYIEIPNINPGFPFQQSSISDKYEERKKKYINTIERIFCYKYYSNDEYDILTFNVSYLKQNTSVHFPSYLIFENVPESIRYEIRSKNMPNVQEGVIQIEQ